MNYFHYFFYISVVIVIKNMCMFLPWSNVENVICCKKLIIIFLQINNSGTISVYTASLFVLIVKCYHKYNIINNCIQNIAALWRS